MMKEKDATKVCCCVAETVEISNQIKNNVVSCVILQISVVAGSCCQPKLLIKTLCQSVQTSFQLEPPAFDGKSRQMLHGVLESLQSIRCLALQ